MSFGSTIAAETMASPHPLCFVLMPFGRKPDSAGMIIDFDGVYEEVIRPAIVDAALEPLRADEEMTGGIIHKPMFERLILCPFAVADLTTANANVFYELGIRHAVRPASTVMLFAEGTRLPFDVAMMRALPYRLTPQGRPADAAGVREALRTRLAGARRTASESERPPADSPIFQLVENFPDIQHTKTDVFRARVDYARSLKDRLRGARQEGLDSVKEFEKELGPLDGVESGVLIDLFLSYRSVKAWQEMIDLAGRMPRPLAATVMVQEQLALALNRAGRDAEAEAALQSLLAARGASSETYGILGRVYKDRWERAEQGGDRFLARGLLEKAIEAYLRGFESDFRDAYPGVNAVTLMELRDPPDPRRRELIPVVTYAVRRKMAAGDPDYWDFATLLELAVIAGDREKAEDALSRAQAAIRERWEPETTLRNIRLIVETRRRRSESVPEWLDAITAALKRASA